MSFLARGVLCIGAILLSISTANALCFDVGGRTIKVGPGFGASGATGQFDPASMLRAKEVVLTFDDGPFEGTTNRILDVLNAHCAKATFFVVGSMALAAPTLTRRIRLDGHTVAVHSHTHSNLQEIDHPAAVRDIRVGFGAVQVALGGKPAAAFFRFPYLADSDELKKYLAGRGIAVFGRGKFLIDSDDWMEISAEDVAARVMAGLRARGKGVVLMHDIQPKTVRALPHLLEALDAQGYKVVHLVPRGGVPGTLAIDGFPGLKKANEFEEKDEPKIATLSARERVLSVENFIDNVK